MKALLLGNSHTGCILRASKEAGKELDSFGIPGGLGPDIEVLNGYVKKGPRHGKNPKTNILNGLSEGVRLDDYSHIIFSTLGSADPQFVNRNHPMVRFARADMVVDKNKNFQLISQDFMETLVEAFVVGMFATESLITLSNAFKNPIYVQPVPIPLRSALDATITPIVAQYGENATVVMSQYFEHQFSVLKNIVDGLGSNVHLLPYPEPEAVKNGFSSEKLGNIQSNPWHMSSNYGELILRQVDELRCDDGSNQGFPSGLVDVAGD